MSVRSAQAWRHELCEQPGPAQDRHAQFCEVLVASGVIGVHVRIHEKSDWCWRQRLQRSDDAIGYCRRLRIHQENPVGPYKSGGASTLAINAINIAAQ